MLNPILMVPGPHNSKKSKFLGDPEKDVFNQFFDRS